MEVSHTVPNGRSMEGFMQLAPIAEKDGEKGGRFPTAIHGHSLGLIFRSHFYDYGRIESGLIGNTKTPFTRHLQKEKQNHREDHRY